MTFDFKKIFEDHSFVAVMHTDEDWQKYIDALNLSQNEREVLHTMKDFRKKEWLSARMAFLLMLGKAPIFIKDEFGKPWLKDDNHYISISHSLNKVAIIYHSKRVGIDIQQRQDKILKLAPKFILPTEIEALKSEEKLDCFHYYWGAKESLFKAYGEKKVDFKKHLKVDKMNPKTLQAVQASIHKENYTGQYNVHFESLNEYYLAYVIEQ